MEVIVGIVSSLVTAIIVLLITRFFNRKDNKYKKLKSMEEALIRIDSRMSGIKSFSHTLDNHESRISAREIICDNNHKWDGVDRRTK